MDQKGVFQESPVPEAARGIRTLEEKFNNLVRRIQLIEQNMLNYNRKGVAEFRSLNEELNEIRKDIDSLNDKISLIAKELQTVAKKEDVDVLRKYLDLWEPVNFVTQSEVEKLVKKAIDENTNFKNTS